MSRARDIADFNASLFADDEISGDKVSGGNIGAGTFDGTIGSNATGFTGVKVLDVWRLSTTLTSTRSPITDNLERVNTTPNATAGIGLIGSPMTVDSNGIFTFPMTGIYTIDFSATFNLNNTAQYVGLIIRSVVSGSTNILVRKYSHITRANSTWTYTSMHLNTTFNCSNPSTHKVRFDYSESHSATAQLIGDATTNPTSFKFMRIGDT